MTFEERQFLRQKISDIQRAKELLARRMHIKTMHKTKLYLGGGSRPYNEQIRSGYPHADDPAEGKRKRAA